MNESTEESNLTIKQEQNNWGLGALQSQDSSWLTQLSHVSRTLTMVGGKVLLNRKAAQKMNHCYQGKSTYRKKSPVCSANSLTANTGKLKEVGVSRKPYQLDDPFETVSHISGEAEADGEERRFVNRVRTAAYRAGESPEEREARQISNRIRAAARRAEETPTEREARRYANRLRAAARRAEETPAEREARQSANRLRAAARRACETEAEREARRSANRLRVAARRACQTQAEREAFQCADRLRVAARRAMETGADLQSTDRLVSVASRERQIEARKEALLYADRLIVAARRAGETEAERWACLAAACIAREIPSEIEAFRSKCHDSEAPRGAEKSEAEEQNFIKQYKEVSVCHEGHSDHSWSAGSLSSKASFESNIHVHRAHDDVFELAGETSTTRSPNGFTILDPSAAALAHRMSCIDDTHIRPFSQVRNVCDVYSNSFQTSDITGQHLATHPFITNTCGEHSLREHEQICSGAKLHSCEYCGQRLVTSCSGGHFACSHCMKCCERLHVDARPYCCQDCGKRFRRRLNLIGHVLSVHAAAGNTGSLTDESCGDAGCVSRL